MGTTLKFLSENTVRKCTFGNPDNVNLDRVPEDFDWIYDSPRREDLPHRTEIEEEAL